MYCGMGGTVVFWLFLHNYMDIYLVCLGGTVFGTYFTRTPSACNAKGDTDGAGTGVSRFALTAGLCTVTPFGVLIDGWDTGCGRLL